MGEGWFYYFLRVTGPRSAGHIGWGCQLPARYLCGALENVTHGDLFTFRPAVYDNDYWSAFFPSEEGMINEMRTVTEARRRTNQPAVKPYTHYKKVPVAEPDPKAAIKTGMFWNGYHIVDNTCLTNTARVATAYGVDRTLRRRWHNVLPRAFFHDVLSEYEAVPLQ